MNAKATIASACLLAAAASAQPIRVLTLDDSRTLVCQNIDFNVRDGNAFEEVRDALLDAANFGSGGTVDREIELLTSVPRITRASLNFCDLVLLSASDTDQQLDVCERRTLREFIEAGGGVFMFHNDAEAGGGPILGATPGDASVGDGVISDMSNPVADGPFGSVSGAIGMSFHKGFVDVGTNGSAFATSSQDYGATFEFGAGRAVLYCDEESFMSLSANGCAAGRLGGKEMTLFLNAVAFIAPEPGFRYNGDAPCCVADMNLDGAVNTLDVLTFLNDWTIAGPFADINGDGNWNTQDVLAFLNLWNAGC